jgi:type I restriction enzyme S subunit
VRHGVGDAWGDYRLVGAFREGIAPAKEGVGKQPGRYKPVFAGTVFYNPMRIQLGSIAFVDEGDEPGNTSPDYVAVRGREGVLDSRWFYYWFRSPLGEQLVDRLSRGAVRERMLFNRLAKGEIELPPYDVQLEASRKLRYLARLQRIAEAQLAEINALPAAVLRRAFNGEL